MDGLWRALIHQSDILIVYICYIFDPKIYTKTFVVWFLFSVLIRVACFDGFDQSCAAVTFKTQTPQTVTQVNEKLSKHRRFFGYSGCAEKAPVC